MLSYMLWDAATKDAETLSASLNATDTDNDALWDSFAAFSDREIF